MKSLQLFTTNPNKIKEYQQYASTFGVTFDVYANTESIPELQSEDPEDVLRSKMQYVQDITNVPFIVEDTIFLTSRYKNFPGTNAKFINKTLGMNGWKCLFEEGDPISAITVIGLSYLGKQYVFKGQLDGVISFAHTGAAQDGAPINALFFVPTEGKFLANLVKEDYFENHRKKALKSLCQFLQKCEEEEHIAMQATAARWDKRAKTWGVTLEDQNSFPHYEDGFQRFSSVISKFLPVISGRILDIGCGNGEVAKQIAEKEDVTVLGIDVSQEMIHIAEREEKQNLRFMQGSLEDLAGKDLFEGIVSRGILISHLPFTAVVDYLQNVTALAKENAYFIFDILQNPENGDSVPQHTLTAFTRKRLCGIMHELGWVHIYAEGTDMNRVRTLVFQKYAKGSIYFVTGNALKIQEIKSVIGASEKQIQFFGIEIDEIKSDDLERIVADKLLKSFAVVQKPVICTDGGIFIEALNGFPGENSKQAAKKLGADGLLTLLSSASSRKAVRKNCMGYYDGSIQKIVTAEIECEMSTEVRGTYPAYELDKILIPISNQNPQRLTYAEMPVEARVKFTELPQLGEFIKTLQQKKAVVP